MSESKVANQIMSCYKNILEFRNRFGKGLGSFQTDIAFQHAVIFNVIRIGELSRRLLEDLRNEEIEAICQRIQQMQDSLLSECAELDLDKLWKILNKDLPQLNGYCQYIGQELLFTVSDCDSQSEFKG